MFENEQLTSRLTSFFGEAKRSLELEGRYFGVSLAQRLARLLAGMAIAAVLIVVGGIVLLFGSFALAYWLSELTGSMLVGFGILALVLAAVLLLAYVRRREWFVEPIVRGVASLLVSDEMVTNTATLDAAEQRIGSERQQARGQLRQQADSLIQPAKRSANRWETASNLITNLLAIYEGLQMGRSTIMALRRLFKK